MVNLFLDTDILIGFIAKDRPTGILEQLVAKINDNQIRILTNEIIKDEWERNKDKTKDGLKKVIENELKSARRISEFLQDKEKEVYNNILDQYISEENKRFLLVDKRIQYIDDLLNNAKEIKVSKKIKLKVIKQALRKKAPFITKKNSVGDALNLLSLHEFVINKNVPYNDTIFVSFNYTDFSSKENPDELHEDLKNYFDESGIVYKRNIGEALNLSEEMIKEIDEYIEDYVDYMTDSIIQDMIDERRGK